jgi:hypothetical protein
MGDVNEYRQIVEKVITDIGAILTSTPELARNVILDRSSDNYLILTQGWENRRRINHAGIHLQIINGKIWIQEDNTDLNIARELELAGVPKSDIVLGFHPPDIRPYTDYAAA